MAITSSIVDCHSMIASGRGGLIESNSYSPASGLPVLGTATRYEYYPETTPGGNTGTTSPRQLNPSTGGYLKRYTSSIGDIPDLNANNLWQNYTYDIRGNITGTSSYSGDIGSFSFNPFDEVREQIFTSSLKETLSPISYRSTYLYDKNGNLKEESMFTDVLNLTRQYTYDTRENLTQLSDSMRGLTSYSYNNNNNVTSISGPDTSMSFQYDTRDMVQVSTYGNKSYSYTYDGNGNMLTMTDPYNITTSYQYDGYDRMSRITDGLNNQTLIGYGQNSHLVSTKFLDSTQQLIRQSIEINDPLGRVQSNTLHSPGLPDVHYSYEYRDNGRTIIITDPLNRQSIIEKDQFGRVLRETDAIGNINEYFYEDERGNMTRKKETWKNGESEDIILETLYKYNAHNKVEQITDPKGNSSYFYYDAKGNLTGTKDAEGNIITHVYNDAGQKISTRQELENGQQIVTQFEYYPMSTFDANTNTGVYNPGGRLKAVIDDKGNRTSYEYDRQGRTTRIVYPDGTFSQYQYDIPEDTFWVMQETQRNGTVIKNYYDKFQRLAKRQILPVEGVGGTTLENYDYDSLSRMTRAQNGQSVVEYNYDNLNRITQESLDGKHVNYGYDIMNNLTSIQYPNGRMITREFDPLNRMNKISQSGNIIAEMAHAGRSYQLLRKQYGNGDLITYLYDQGRNLTQINAKNKNTDLINGYGYGYNKVGMKSYEERGHEGNRGDVYTYDNIYRLTDMKINTPEPQNLSTDQFEKRKTVQFDRLSNITSIMETQNDQVKTIEPIIPDSSDYSKLNQYAQFDAWALSYDKNGNTTQKGTQQFAYDYRNHIISAHDIDTTENYTYDALGRRIQKSITSGSQTKTTHYYYSGNQIIEECDSTDAIQKQFIYGTGIDEIIRMDKYSDSSTFVPYYYQTDATGSVTAITDSEGKLVERIDYDLYGMPTITDYQTDPANPSIVSNSTIGNDILYQGRQYDKETNLYYYRARYYDPIMARFLQTDPIGYADSMNLYQAFNMNGVNFVDPTGKIIYIESKELRAIFEQILGIELKFKDPQKPNKVTSFYSINRRLIKLQEFFTDIVKSPKEIEVIDITNDMSKEANSIRDYNGGGAFDPISDNKAIVQIDINTYAEYGYFDGIHYYRTTMTQGEKMLHEIIGHGYDFIIGFLKFKLNYSTEEKFDFEISARKRMNKYYRSIKNQHERGLQPGD